MDKIDLNLYDKNSDPCYVEQFDLVVSLIDDFDLTYGKVYSVRSVDIGMISVKNDKGLVDLYSIDFFDKYIL